MEKAKKAFGIIVCSILGVLAVVGIASANTPTTEVKEVEETIHYAVKTTYDSNMREGNKEVKQEGKDGLKKVVYEVYYKGGKEIDRKKQSETVLKEAVDKEVVEGTKKYYVCSNGVEYETLEEKNECNAKVAWEKQRDTALAECNADSSKTNCWYDEYPGTTLHWKNYTKPSTTAPKTNSSGRTGAICKDGWRSSATGRGACSHHGGVAYWI